jgi:hypothetical protein
MPLFGEFDSLLAACCNAASSGPTARTNHKNVLWRAVDVNRPVTLRCVPDAVRATRARTVTSGSTSPKRLVTGGPVRKTTSGVLNTVAPSQLRPPDNTFCQKVKAMGLASAGCRTASRTLEEILPYQRCYAHPIDRQISFVSHPQPRLDKTYARTTRGV